MKDWTKTVKPNWRLWCGNLWTPDVPAITDGFTVHLEEVSDPVRYAKLRDQASYRAGTYPGLTLTLDGSEEAYLEEVWDVRELYPRLRLKYLALLRGESGTLVMVNAERLRNALLVAPGKGLRLGSGGWLYVTDRAAAQTIDLFGESAYPLAAIAPMESPYGILRRLEDEQEQGRGPVWRALPR